MHLCIIALSIYNFIKKIKLKFSIFFEMLNLVYYLYETILVFSITIYYLSCIIYKFIYHQVFIVYFEKFVTKIELFFNSIKSKKIFRSQCYKFSIFSRTRARQSLNFLSNTLNRTYSFMFFDLTLKNFLTVHFILIHFRQLFLIITISYVPSCKLKEFSYVIAPHFLLT